MTDVTKAVERMLRVYGDMVVQFTNGYKKDFFFSNRDSSLRVSISCQMPIQLNANMTVTSLWDGGSHFFELHVNDNTVFGYEDGDIWMDDVSVDGELSDYDMEKLARKI